MGVFRQLLLILWKGGLIRLRHYIMTFLEIVIPLLLIIVLTYLRSLIGPLSSIGPDITPEKHPPTFYERKQPLDTYNSRVTLLYTPNKEPFTKLIKQSVDLIEIENSFTDWDVVLKGVDSEEEILSEYLRGKMNDSSRWSSYVGVIFRNVNDAGKLQENLDYELRLTGNFQTSLKYLPYVTTGPRYDGFYGYREFLLWQAAIDQTFVKLKQEEKESPNSVLQMVLYLLRYPYPAYTSNTNQLTLIFMIPTVVVNGLIFMMPFFVKRIIDEKACRAKELMRMMGLNDFVYFLGTFANTFIIAVIFTSITTILFKINFVKGAAVLDYTDGSLFWVIMTLFMANGLLFCMVISAFFNKAVLGAIITYIVWNFSFSLPTYILDPLGMTGNFVELSLAAKVSTCLIPSCSFHWACRIISMFEGIKTGATWGKLFQTALPEDNFNLGMVFGMMLLSTILYSFLFWYVDSVWPWQVGIPKSPAFIFMPSYWCPKRKIMNSTIEDHGDEYLLNKKHFEALPPDQPPGIILSHLSKEFGRGASKKVAVDRVSLSMLKGHITVLLGHNGAGKTTTMNVLTGIMTPSGGTASIDGFDILESTKEARSSLGLCPQHNVLYDSLTVEEHLKFFAGLKGMRFSEFPEEVTKTLRLLDLEAKRTNLSRVLSGGMKRKLSLGIAFIANSKVLILDEPTSGLDPQARRAVWDLLQSIRHERTILLTTHYMEEADVLGDRIAIMAEGRVQCSGSPFFLKKAFGAGYHLRMSKGEDFDLQSLKTIIQKHVPDMYTDSDSPTEVVFVLPVQDTNAFVPLFDDLEQNRKYVGYNSCGVSITTMEDVFLKVGQLSERKTAQEIINIEEERNGELVNGAQTRLSGSKLICQKAYGLLLKRFHDAKRYWAFLLFQVVLPCIVISIMLHVIRIIKLTSYDDDTPLNLKVGNFFGQTQGLYSGEVPTEYDALLTSYEAVLKDNRVNPNKVDDPVTKILELGEKDLNDYKYHYLVGGIANISGSDNKLNLLALYNGEPFHTAAMTMNLMDTAWLRYATKQPNSYINTINHPFPDTYKFIRDDPFQTLPIQIMFAIFLPLALSFLAASFVLFPVHERVTKSKLIQRMTGLGGVLFWGCHFVWDYLMFFVASILIMIPFVAVNPDIYGNNDGILGVVFLMLLFYGWSVIPFAYILSFLGKKPSTSFMIANSISFITGLIFNIALGLYKSLTMGIKDIKVKPDDLAWAFRILPDFAITWGLTNVHSIGVYNSFCRNVDPVTLNAMCPVLKPNERSPYLPCCPVEYCKDACFKPKEYLTFDAGSCGRDLLFMALSGYIFFGLLVAMESNFVRFWYRLTAALKRRVAATKPDTMFLLQHQQNGNFADLTEDDDVTNERNDVEEICVQNNTTSVALVVRNLSKSFAALRAVDRLSFTVKDHECFGLLGVNGAGKTTTFSMLTGDLTVDGGDAFIKTFSLKDHLPEFQKYIGYCPQFDALLDRMTGREALTFFARLRGIREKEIGACVNEMIVMTDLSEHAEKIAEKYSGGTRRKLSLAVALIGSPQIVFLDEPTSGVDPSSRRKIWKALLKMKMAGTSSFILTTHSMEECEALCGRLAIMVNGQFRCLGPIQNLKTKFGQGYTILLKLKRPDYMFQLEDERTVALKNHMDSTFPNIVLKDFHQGLLHYHLNDTSVQWSHLFREMERAKGIFELEDYFISDTTLEQIFIAFARTQRIVAA